MKTTRTLIPAALIAALAAVPAQAHDKRGGDDHGKSKSERQAEWQAKRCEPRLKRYEAKATLATAALTKNADGSYDGTFSGTVERTNRHARAHQGTTQTWTVDDAKLKFRGPDRNNDGAVDHADLQPGDRVEVQGRITTLRRTCDATAFTPALTVKKAKFKAPRAAQTPAQPTPRGDDKRGGRGDRRS